MKLFNVFLAVFFVFCTNHAVSVFADGESRWVKRLVYDSESTYPLTFYRGYVVRIDLAEDDKVRDIVLGNNLGWQIQSLDNRIFIKTLVSGLQTNMTVIATDRVYEFLLTSDSIDSDEVSPVDAAYRVKFINLEQDSHIVVPEKQPSKLPTEEAPNIKIKTNIDTKQNLKYINEGSLSAVVDFKNIYSDYAFVGPDEIAPTDVFDDTIMTYFAIDSSNSWPIVLIPCLDNKNYQRTTSLVVGKFFVVRGVHKQLRVMVGEKYIDIVRLASEGKS